MRHGFSGRRLSRTTSHRRMLFSNMANSLIRNEHIKTTLPKAKEMRSYMDRLVTLAKRGGMAQRRRAFARLRDRATVDKLFSILAPRYEERPGGYTRVLRAGFRYGDAAPMAFLELVERDMEAKGSDSGPRPQREEGEETSS